MKRILETKVGSVVDLGEDGAFVLSGACENEENGWFSFPGEYRWGGWEFFPALLEVKVRDTNRSPLEQGWVDWRVIPVDGCQRTLAPGWEIKEAVNEWAIRRTNFEKVPMTAETIRGLVQELNVVVLRRNDGFLAEFVIEEVVSNTEFVGELRFQGFYVRPIVLKVDYIYTYGMEWECEGWRLEAGEGASSSFYPFSERDYKRQDELARWFQREFPNLAHLVEVDEG